MSSRQGIHDGMLLVGRADTFRWRNAHVAYGSKADMTALSRDVRFTPKADTDQSALNVRKVPEADIDLIYYSITLVASASIGAGIAIPSAFAVFRLMTNSNLVDCITGRFAGLSPLRMRPA